jgi:hypothetical protein
MKSAISNNGSVMDMPNRHTQSSAVPRWSVICALVLLTACALFASAGRSIAAEAQLAIKGYDPVAYFMDGKPTPGRPELQYEWDEHVWRFATAEHRDLFRADPVRYAPQFGNYCAMALSKGEVVIADPENWLVNAGRLYVFGKPAPAGPALFGQNLEENIAKANQSRSVLPH